MFLGSEPKKKFKQNIAKLYQRSNKNRDSRVFTRLKSLFRLH